MDGREAVDTEFFQRHLMEAGAWMANVWRQNEIGFIRAFPSNVQSPLEAAFMAWWDAHSKVHSFHHRVALFPQYEVDAAGVRYRLDFAVLPRQEVVRAAEKHGIPLRAVAVELDGHDYHERTKEQVTYRNQRDRWLLSAGWHTLHFSGSELNSRPVECVHQAVTHAAQLSGEIEQAVIDKGGYGDMYEP